MFIVDINSAYHFLSQKWGISVGFSIDLRKIHITFSVDSVWKMKQIYYKCVEKFACLNNSILFILPKGQ